MTHEASVKAACWAKGAAPLGLTHRERPVDYPLLLWTLSGLESSHGRDRLFVRHEPGYMPGGRYYQADKWKVYGVLASSSFGSFQLMYQVATELGFAGHPIELQDDMTCAAWAATLIEQRIVKRQGAKTLRDVLDAYNSGSHRDGLVPAAYIKNGILLYEEGWPGETA